jgi:stage II sporulation protein D
VRGSVALAVLAAVAGASPAAADFRIDGHGFGHGVGLAQYGAKGYAEQEGRGYRWILGHYFTGARRRGDETARVRVRLRQRGSARVSGVSALRDAAGRRLALRADRRYRMTPLGTARLAVADERSGAVRHVEAPVTLTGRGFPRLLGLAENGVRDGSYRGRLVLARAGEEVLVIDDVGLEGYLRGVVPAEMPASWPAGALKAQAVAARSYAVTSLRPAQPFDVFADTRSQVYRGVTAEQPATTAAVEATRGIVLTADGAVARTLFHSSSGGRTAASEEIFGGPPVSYLRSVEDRFDSLSPHHDWSVSLTDAEVAARLSLVLQGELLDLAVVSRTPSDRAAVVRITGSAGATDIPATQARTLLGLRSTWFTIART